MRRDLGGRFERSEETKAEAYCRYVEAFVSEERSKMPQRSMQKCSTYFLTEPLARSKIIHILVIAANDCLPINSLVI